MSGSKVPEEIQPLLPKMRTWLNSQPHLPKDVDDQILVRFIHSCYYDLEKAQAAAELFFTIRGSSPELLDNRDIESPAMKKMLGVVKLAQLPISGNRSLWIWQLNDPGLEVFDYLSDAKVFLMSTDSWLLEDTNLPDADIVLMDTKDISLKFITKFNISIARTISKYQQEAMPIRLKQIHIVNAPPIIDKLFSLMKTILKQEITDMIHFHTAKSDTLYKYISKEDLPTDFGGTQGSMEEHNEKVLAQLRRHREKLNTPLWRATIMDKKSKKKQSVDEVTTFRSLAID